MSSIVSLKAAHLPADLRPLLEQFDTATATVGELQQRLAYTPRLSEQYDTLAQQRDEAAASAQVARDGLIEATSTNGGRMREHLAGAFLGAVDRARAAIATAEAELRDAAQAAALYASVQPGRPVINGDSQAGADSKARQLCMLAVSQLREIDPPDAVEA